MSNKTIVLAALVFVLIYNLLFFHTSFGIGTGLLFLIINLYFFVIRNPKDPSLPFALTSSTVAVLFGFLFAYRSNIVIQLINFFAAGFFSLTALALYKGLGRPSLQLPVFLSIPFSAVGNLLMGIFQVFKKESWPTANSGSSIFLASVLKGLAILVPIAGLLLILLARADPIFSKLTQDFLSQVGERTAVSLILFLVMLGIGISKFKEKLIDTEEVARVGDGKSHELIVITGGVLLLFTLFIGVQFRYLFSSVGEGDLASLGINSLTYSEYVRKGFFELLIASVIACGVIVYSLRFIHHLKNAQKLLVQILSGILTIETGLLLLSAVQRLSLYADAHGLTRVRVFGFIFLVWLATLLAIFLIRVIKQMKKEWFFGSVMTITLIALLSINVFNIDGLIATSKYVPTVNEEVDYYYLTNLSPDAYQSWKPALQDIDQMLSELEQKAQLSADDNRRLNWAVRTMNNLNIRMSYLVSKYGSVDEMVKWYQGTGRGSDGITQIKDSNGKNLPVGLAGQRTWQAFNLAEYIAYISIVKDFSLFNSLGTFQDRRNKLMIRVSDEVQRNTPIDRSTQPPLM